MARAAACAANGAVNTVSKIRIPPPATDMAAILR